MGKRKKFLPDFRSDQFFTDDASPLPSLMQFWAFPASCSFLMGLPLNLSSVSNRRVWRA